MLVESNHAVGFMQQKVCNKALHTSGVKEMRERNLQNIKAAKLLHQGKVDISREIFLTPKSDYETLSRFFCLHEFPI